MKTPTHDNKTCEDAQKNARPRELPPPLPASSYHHRSREISNCCYRVTAFLALLWILNDEENRHADRYVLSRYLHMNVTVYCFFSMLVLANLLLLRFLCRCTLEGRDHKLLHKIVYMVKGHVKVESKICFKWYIKNVYHISLCISNIFILLNT